MKKSRRLDNPYIPKDKLHKKSAFQLQSKNVRDMREGDIEIKDCDYDVGEVNIISWDDCTNNFITSTYR